MMKKINLAWAPLIAMMGIASCSNADGNYQERYNKLLLAYNKQVYMNGELAKANRQYHADIVQLEGELDTLKRTIRNKSRYAQINKLYDDEKAKNKILSEELSLIKIEADTLYENIEELIKYLKPKLPNVTIAIGNDDNITVNGAKLIKD